jgi:hypothetical protein
LLSRVTAVALMQRWTKRSYGHVWTKGRGRSTRCPVRSSDAQLGCFSVWSYRGRVYSKSRVISEDQYGDFTYSRDFASAPIQVQVVTAPSTTTTPVPASADFCSTHVCIPNYDNGTGSTVQCSDGSYSHSGGIQGACSHHGGVAHAMGVLRARATATRPPRRTQQLQARLTTAAVSALAARASSLQ